jgi:protein-S-isoprenylcysteine O-methyltransferase Ste14
MDEQQIGERIRAHREKKAWTQEHLALAASVSPRTVQRAEEGVGQCLLVPNGLVGQAFLLPLALLYAHRVGAEERMMLDAFGPAYATYSARTKRLVPGVL